MSKINIDIPQQASESIRDRIADILIDELPNQFQRTYDAYINAFVTVENIDPEDLSKLTSVNISLATGSYDNKDYAGSVKGTYQYFIDCYSNAKVTSDNSGDFLSANRLQKLMGVCRYILENPVYKTLGYQPPFIYRVYFSRFDIRSQSKNDARNSMMGRMVFNVEVMESTSLIVPDLIAGYDTTVKISNSNTGYLYEGDNY